jgi:hypothetical protein
MHYITVSPPHLTERRAQNEIRTIFLLQPREITLRIAGPLKNEQSERRAISLTSFHIKMAFRVGSKNMRWTIHLSSIPSHSFILWPGSCTTTLRLAQPLASLSPYSAWLLSSISTSSSEPGPGSWSPFALEASVSTPDGHFEISTDRLL